MTVETIGGVTVLFYPPTGTRIGNESDATRVVNEALNQQAAWVAVAVTRFDDMFFHLSTRMAGEFIQKFVNYRVGLAILGDISEHTRASAALRSFVNESNRRSDVWFLADGDALRARLADSTSS